MSSAASLESFPERYAKPRGIRHHMLIAGTGRAGTSALVRYLAALGLETHLSRPQGDGDWNETAQAGLEDMPLTKLSADLPYVVKTPWAYQLIEETLADPEIHLDAAIIPVRDLIEAASSRTIVELQAVHRAAPWMTETTTWDDWGLTPGGSVFSLNPTDQARLLAVGFHRLLERLVQSDVPIIFLAFPRFATDQDYLFSKLRPVLPADISLVQARDAHGSVFRAADIRVARELKGEADSKIADASVGRDQTALDNAALKRELRATREQLEAERRQTDRLRRELNFSWIWRLRQLVKSPT